MYYKPVACYLAFNERDEWELPGGRLEEVETLSGCVEQKSWRRPV